MHLSFCTIIFYASNLSLDFFFPFGSTPFGRGLCSCGLQAPSHCPCLQRSLTQNAKRQCPRRPRPAGLVVTGAGRGWRPGSKFLTVCRARLRFERHCCRKGGRDGGGEREKEGEEIRDLWSRNRLLTLPGASNSRFPQCDRRRQSSVTSIADVLVLHLSSLNPPHLTHLPAVLSEGNPSPAPAAPHLGNASCKLGTPRPGGLLHTSSRRLGRPVLVSLRDTFAEKQIRVCFSKGSGGCLFHPCIPAAPGGGVPGPWLPRGFLLSKQCHPRLWFVLLICNIVSELQDVRCRRIACCNYIHVTFRVYSVLAWKTAIHCDPPRLTPTARPRTAPVGGPTVPFPGRKERRGSANVGLVNTLGILLTRKWLHSEKENIIDISFLLFQIFPRPPRWNSTGCVWADGAATPAHELQQLRALRGFITR